jgi:CMP-N-acetylneuraminic acid synthetase
MKNILLLGMAREKSTRVPYKMIRNFSETNLYKIYLRKLEMISKTKHPFSRIVMAISPTDKTLYKFSKKTNVEIFGRSNQSATGSSFLDIYDFLDDFSEDYIMSVNGCSPFLKLETILKIGFFFKNSRAKGLVCVRERRNDFWDPNSFRNINCKTHHLATQEIPPLLESVRHIMIYDRKFAIENKRYWDLKTIYPFLYKISDDEECLDIDTELEFQICETMWRIRNGKF